MIDSPSRSQPDRAERRADPSPPGLEILSSGANGDRVEYTFVPRDASGDELLTTWLTVDGEGLVDLVDWR